MTILNYQLRRAVLFGFGIAVVVIGGGYYYLTGGRYVTTENAYLQADTATISSNVAGRVVAIEVEENQWVDAGQLLVRLNPEPYEIALERIKARLTSVASNVEVLRATYRQRRAELRREERDVAYFDREYQRQKSLLAQGMTPKSTHDAAEQALEEARAKTLVARKAVEQILAAFDGSIDTPTEALGMYREVAAEVRQAELNLSYTLIRAPFAGVVGKLSALRPGDYATPGGALFVVVDIAHPWVEARFKETDLTYVLGGQSAQLRVDAYPDHHWSGEVSSLAPASQSEFSLLPAQNSTGNWVKVVQRIPIRLAIEQHENDPPLRAGMSVRVTIDTGHQRFTW